MAARCREHPVAVQHLAPYAEDDCLPLKECSALLRETGYPASVSTLRRWIASHDLTTGRDGRVVVVSFSDILEVHRDEILAKDQ